MSTIGVKAIKYPDGDSAINITDGGNVTLAGTLGVTGTSTLSSGLVMTSDDPTITMTDASGTNDIGTIQSISGALILTARDGSADGEIIFKKTDGSATDETMRIKNDGKVGIGTASPTVKFEANDSTTWDIAHFSSSNAVGAGLSLDATNTGVRWSLIAQGTTGGGNDNNLGFHLTDVGTSGQSAGYKFVMTPAGYFGVGTTSPTANVHIEGTLSVRTSSSQTFNDGNNANNLTMTNAKSHFNLDGADKDFQVSSDNNSHAFFVQAGSDCVGIKTASPNDYYSDDFVVTVPDNGGITIVNSSTHAGCIMFADGTGASAYRGQLVYDHNDDSFGIWTAAVNAMSISSGGAMVRNNQPAFDAARPAASSASSDLTGWVNTYVNKGNHWNASTGRFTCPVAGTYLFYGTGIKSSSTTTTTRYYLKRNGSFVHGSRHLRLDGGNVNTYGDNGTMQWMVTCSAGDYIQANITNGTVYSATPEYTIFGGYLLC